MSGSLVASQRANAALTATGFSCAIQWPDATTTSVRSAQSRAHRLGQARGDGLAGVVVGAVQEQHRQRQLAAVPRTAARTRMLPAWFMYQEFGPKKPLRVSAAA